MQPTNHSTALVAGASGHVGIHNGVGGDMNQVTKGALPYPFPTDGSDLGALVQAAYDEGYNTVTLRPDIDYLWDSPVFIDKVDAHKGLTIIGNKANIRLGPNLPTTNWTPDTTTRFAIFPNTLRSALSGGVVTVNDANRATGTGGALRSLIVRDVTIDGQAAYRGFSFANRTGCTFENVIFYRGRVLHTWWDYPDQQTFIAPYSRGGSGPAEQVIAEQYQQGDGLLFLGGKADSSVGLARLSTCRGGVFDGVVTGKIELSDCTGIVIRGAHQEGQQSTRTMLAVKNSQVLIEGGSWYENWSATVPTITIDDSTGTETASEVTLRSVITNGLWQTTTGAVQFSPILSVLGSADNTKIIFDNVHGMHTSTGIAGSWVDSRQPYLDGTSPVQTCLALPKSRAIMASGSFVLRRLPGGTTWSVDSLTHPQLYVSTRVATRPVITAITVSTGMTGGGTLTSGTVYAYAVAIIDAQGNYSQASIEVTATAGTTGQARILISLADGPGTLIIWRKTTAGVLTAPDRYAVMTVRGARTYLYDTGGFIAGLPWITTSVPVPNTVAATNSTVAALVLNGLAITS